METKTIFTCWIFLSALIVTGLYMSCSIYFPSFLDFWRGQVTAYLMDTSLFDLWIFCLVKLLLLYIFRVTYFVVIGFGFAMICVFYVVKCYAFEFSMDRPLELATLIVSFILAAVEVILWTFVSKSLPSPFGPLKTTSRTRTKSRSKSFSKKKQIVGINDDSDSPLMGEVDEAGFVSAEELSSGDDEFVSRASFHGRSKGTELTNPEFNYTPHELELIVTLRQRYPQFRDEKLYRFLIARNFDLARADEMLRAHAAWRKKMNLDSLDFSRSPLPTRGFFCHPDTNGEGGDADVQNLLRYAGACVHKFSNDGLPLVLVRAGWSDLKGVVSNNKIEAVEKTAIFVVEYVLQVMAPELEKRTGKEVAKMSMVMDLEGLGIRQLYAPALSYLTHMIQIAEANYPESVGIICIINAPSIFQAFWKIVKPVIPPRTLTRIHFLGADYKSTLLTLFPPENLPAHLGGLCTCRYQENCVPWAKSKGYTDPNRDEGGYQVKGIPPGGVFNIPFAAREDEMKFFQKNKGPKMTIKVSYLTNQALKRGFFFLENFDPNFKISDAAELVPMEGRSAGSKIHEDVFHVDRSGLYVLHVVNQSNMVLTLRYMITGD